MPAPTLPKKKPIHFGITGKIWLAISIMIVGYLITIGQVALIGNYTKQRHRRIATHLFPAALQAQTNLLSFQAQIDHFQSAVLLGEIEQLHIARNYTTTINTGLKKLTSDRQLQYNIRIMGNDLILRHKAFTNQAFALYSQMMQEHPSKELLSKASLLAELTEQLNKNFQTMSTNINQQMNTDLAEINTYLKHKQKTSLLTFLATVTISIILVAFILARTILRPLKKTVHLANLMASGDLSQKVDIQQQDEIGELASAMNAMADQIKRAHTRMETLIAKRTLTLRKTNEQLRIEVRSKQDAQQEIFTALELAKQANEAKSTFIANMSHEIRTPMNGIVGMTGLLLETPVSATQKNYLHTLRSSAQALLAILNDILDFGKIEAGKLRLDIHEFNPLEVVSEVSDILTLRAQDKGLELSTLIDWKIPPLLQGDQARLRQILLNITDNAIKFTRSGEIILKIATQHKTAETITLLCSVSDTGVGIAPDKLDHIFEPFIQADGSTTRKHGGTGLGLAISRKLIELMDGEIHIESEQDMGTTVWFTATFSQVVQLDHFPAYSHATELIYSTTSQRMSTDKVLQLTGKNVLVAEDEPTSQEVMIALLQTFGITPHIVSDGKQALDAMDEHIFDLILMDCQMPGMNGYDATRAIRKRNSDDRHIPVIALTADTTPEAKKVCLACGMNDYLTKPIDPERLKEYLRKWLQPSHDLTIPPLLIGELVLKRQGGEREKAIQVMVHAEQLAQIYIEELQGFKQRNFPENETDKLCAEVKKLGAHLGIAKLQNQAIHLQLALKDDEHQQAGKHAKSLQMSLLRLTQELKQAGNDYNLFFNP